MFAYPGGGRGGTSSATLLAVVAGSVWLWRRGRRGVVVLLLAPFALALAAAMLRRYPYGMEARQMQFVAPAICLLTGLGAAWLLHAIPWPRARRVFASLALLFLAGFAGASLASDLKRPYRFPYDQQVREFARRFWPAQARAAELACLCSDFGVDDRRTHHLRTALYLCNQWIYSPQRRRTAAHVGTPSRISGRCAACSTARRVPIIPRSWLGSPACSARLSSGGSIGSSSIRREQGRTGRSRTCSSSSSSPDPGRRSPPRPSRAEGC